MNQAAASHREKRCAQNTVQAVGKRKMSSKIQSVQCASTEASEARWPTAAPSEQLAEEPVPWEDALELEVRRQHTLCCPATLPSLLQAHSPALQQHCSHGDKWPSLRESSLWEPWQDAGRWAGCCSPHLPPHSSAPAPVTGCSSTRAPKTRP